MFTYHVNHWDLEMYCNRHKGREELSVSVTLKQKAHQHTSTPLFLAVCLNHRCDIRSRYQTQRWHLFQSNENLLGWRICHKSFEPRGLLHDYAAHWMWTFEFLPLAPSARPVHRDDVTFLSSRMAVQKSSRWIKNSWCNSLFKWWSMG